MNHFSESIRKSNNVVGHFVEKVGIRHFISICSAKKIKYGGVVISK